MTARPIDLTFDLDAPPDKVWRALTTPALLARWLGRNNIRAELGARFGVESGSGANDNVRADCTVLALEPGRLLRLGWREAGSNGDCIDSVVTFGLEANGAGGTRLTLTHDGFVTVGGLPANLIMETPAAGGWRMSWAA